MYQSPATLLQHYLNHHKITPQKFAQISGMPLTEVLGILKGELPVTILRANHLAAAFDTKAEIWLHSKKTALSVHH